MRPRRKRRTAPPAQAPGDVPTEAGRPEATVVAAAVSAAVAAAAKELKESRGASVSDRRRRLHPADAPETARLPDAAHFWPFALVQGLLLILVGFVLRGWIDRARRRPSAGVGRAARTGRGLV